MKATHLCLYAIIKQRLYSLLKPEYIDFFPGKSHEKKILEAAFMLRMKGAEINEDLIKNYLNQDIQNLKEKNDCINIMHDICKDEKYIDINQVEYLLEKEYYDFQFSLIKNTLSDNKSTLEMKKDIIRKTYDIISRTQTVDDFISVKEVLKKILADKIEDKPNELFKSSIKLEDINLITIFGLYIYPHLHSILARPNTYKTSLLLDIIAHFSMIGKKGLLVSTEDIASMIAVKLFSSISGIDKVGLITGQYMIDDFEKALSKVRDNIFIMDRLRTANEMYIDIKNKLLTMDIHYVAVDYLQGAKSERYETETEKTKKMVDVLHELNKEFNIPIFMLSQPPGASIKSRDVLTAGHEKGTSVINEKSRWQCSLNATPSNVDDSNYDLINCNIYKTTMSAKGQVQIEFHKKTGAIASTRMMEV